MSKTIRSLCEMDGRVYVYLANDEIGKAFLRQAEQEGITFQDSVKPTERPWATVMALNHDYTLNYVGFIGMMAYGSGTKTENGEKLIKVDFQTYISES